MRSAPASQAVGLLGRLRALLADPMHRNGYSLVGSTVATSGLGFVYWVVAAHEFTPAEVGRQSALVAMMLLLANLASLNLGGVLNRFIPTAGRNMPRLVITAYGGAFTLAVVVATVFVLGIDLWGSSLRTVESDQVLFVAFVVATGLRVVFVLQDGVLAGLAAGPVVLVENALYSAAKIVALVALAPVLGQDAIFASWAVPMVGAVVLVNWFIFRRAVPTHLRDNSEPAEQLNRRSLGAFVAGDYVATMLSHATVGLQSVLVLSLLGASASGVMYVSWTIAYSLYLVNSSMGMSLVTAGAQHPARLPELSSRAVRMAATIVVPGVIALVVTAPWVLLVFGEQYSAEATNLLRLFALSAVPNIVTATYMAGLRVQRRVRALITVSVVQAVLTTTLIVAFHGRGVAAVGWAWLTTQTVLAAGVALAERRRWIDHLPQSIVDAVSVLRRPIRSRRRDPGADPATAVALHELGQRTSSGAWEPAETLSVSEHLRVVRLAGPLGAAILKVAVGVDDRVALDRHRVALTSLSAGPTPAGWQATLPRVMDHGDGWLVETACPGVDGRQILHEIGGDSLIASAGAAIGHLHRSAALVQVVGSELLDAWVGAPLRRIDAATELCVEPVFDVLSSALLGRRLTLGRTHGDYWPGNVLLDPTSHAVTGIIDWDEARDSTPAALDLAHLVLTTRSCLERRELGSVVISLLDGTGLTSTERALIGDDQGVGEVGWGPFALLAWLHHVDSLSMKSPQMLTRSRWMAANVDRVLRAAGDRPVTFARTSAAPL